MTEIKIGKEIVERWWQLGDAEALEYLIDTELRKVLEINQKLYDHLVSEACFENADIPAEIFVPFENLNKSLVRKLGE